MTDPWEVERLGSAFWPSAIVEERGGFLLRATPAFDRKRNNSALPVKGAEYDLSVVTPFYRGLGLQPAIQVGPAEHLTDLDAQLADRELRIRVDVLIADTATVAARTDRTMGTVPFVRCTEGTVPLVRWVEAWAAAEGRDDVDVHVRELFPRIRHRVAYALAEDGLGVGMCVAGEGWGGIFSMATRPEARGRGVATGVLGALAAWCPEPQLFLQVDPDNAAAQALYARAGFVRSHGYHFRMGS